MMSLETRLEYFVFVVLYNLKISESQQIALHSELESRRRKAVWKQSNETNYFKNKLMRSSVAYMFCPSKHFLWDHQPVITAPIRCFKVAPHPFFPNVFKKRNEKNTWVLSRENCYVNENLVLNIKCTTCMCFPNDEFMRLPFAFFPLMKHSLKGKVYQP